MNILAIDPGNTNSAYCFIDSATRRPIEFYKTKNETIRERLQSSPWCDVVVIERVASYGMAVGREVFETCEWVGRFTEVALQWYSRPAEYIYRMEEKKHICHDSRAKDSNIRRALIDRFAEHDLKTGRGTKKNPDWFYGFHDDIWAAYSCGLTYIETKIKESGGNEL